MCFLEIFKDWGGHIFSICGIIGGIFMYYRHDKKIKKQEHLLNELQIKQIRKTEEQELQAKVECNIIHEKTVVGESVFIIQGKPMLVMSV
mgnify:CR=1 FL=1